MMTQRKSSNLLIVILCCVHFLPSAFLVICTQILDLSLCIFNDVKIEFLDYSGHLLFVTLAKEFFSEFKVCATEILL